METRKDYEIAREELSSEFQISGVKAERSTPAFSTEPMAGSTDKKAWPHFSYTFTFSKNGRMLSEIYNVGADKSEENRGKLMGPAPRREKIPSCSEVLGCLCSEAVSAREASFEDWAEEFGYDSDSIKAKNVYDHCANLWHSLRKILTDEQIATFSQLSSRL